MKSRRFLISAGAGVLLLAAGLLSGVLGKVGTTFKNILVHCLEYIEGLDPVLATITFIGLYVLATLLFVPGLLITMAAGILFGVVKGTAIVSLASVTGSSLAFLVGRYLARDWVAKRTAKNHRFRAIDEAVGRQGLQVVLLLRLSPVFPYNFLNYGLGLTRVTFGRYLLASWIGMFPGTLMYVYLGSAAGSIASLAAGAGGEKTAAQWVLFAVGLLATVAVTVYVTRIAKRALDSQLAVAGQ